MPKPDRLSALMSRFELTVTLCPPDVANFLILGDTERETATSLLLFTGGIAKREAVRSEHILLGATVSWGGADNPLLDTMPSVIRRDVRDDPEIRSLAELFLVELRAHRCGAKSVLNRLGEILIVKLFRHQLHQGATQPGMLAGLADPRLSRAIVAMHDTPSKAWRIEGLADEAGLSPSRFAELFRREVGIPPLSYLRNWRLILAKQDIERGDRIQRVANRYCYGSIEALSRAFSKAHGQSPMQFRKALENA